jgi:hypothetical protein
MGVGQHNKPHPEPVSPETGWTHPCPPCRRRCCASPCRGTPATPENSIKHLSALREQATTHRPNPIRRIRPPRLPGDLKDEKRAWLHKRRNLVPVGTEAEGLECVELGRGPDICVRCGGEEHNSTKEHELWHRKERKAPARREQEKVTVTGSTIPRWFEARCTCQVDMFFSTVLIPSTPASSFFSRWSDGVSRRVVNTDFRGSTGVLSMLIHHLIGSQWKPT